ncbi:hypothetical protein [Rhodococcus pyridinivorans]|uniref:Uncharacterized protein n=1 Tax=Rhodococcus pyridinivorans TaxID=103816 RepID=A0A7M2XRK3_9NOCA|nr:hypothetical protein [Rhodococcus pyridinivorans]QOW00485.1 hypothetical protein INP59_09275 [Rhodococcus pyridinivorans]
MANSPTTQRLYGRLGNRRRFDPHGDHSDVLRDLAASRIADAIDEILAAAPPLTDSQIDRLTALLRGGRR